MLDNIFYSLICREVDGYLLVVEVDSDSVAGEDVSVDSVLLN